MRIRRPLFAMCGIFSLIIFFCTGMKGPKPSKYAYSLDNKTITITGVIADKQNKNGKLKVYLNNVSVKSKEGMKINGIVATVTPPFLDDSAYDGGSKQDDLVDSTCVNDQLHIGQLVEVRGVFELFEEPFNEGQFDARTYYAIRGYEGSLNRARLLGMSESYSVIKDGLRRFRDRAYSILLNTLDEDNAAILAAMTLGDKSNVEYSDKELFQNAGISHVLALSGLHIAIVGLTLLKLLKRMNLPLILSGTIAGGMILAYGIMTGLSNSTLRAMVMFMLAILADIINRTYDLLSAAALSAVGILIENPYYIYDSGFLLSFGAVFAIALVYPLFEEVFRFNTKKRNIKKSRQISKINKIIDNTRKSICVSISITLVTLPIMSSSFYQVSSYSLVLNLIIIPLMSLVLGTGFLGIGIGMLGRGLTLTVISQIGSKTLKITSAIIDIYKALALETTGFAGNLIIIGKARPWQHILYYVFLLLALYFMGLVKSKKCVDRDGLIITSQINKKMTETRNRITLSSICTTIGDKVAKNKALSLIIPCAIITFACFILAYHPREDLEIRNIYVGQGDCSLIIGQDIPNIMIDGGSTDRKNVGKNMILPVLKANRIACIDYCFLTHMDADHISGIMEIIENEACGIRIKNLIVSEAFYKTSEEANSFSEKVANSRTNLVIIKDGDNIDLGKMRITCLNPNKEDVYEGNDSSIVLEIDYCLNNSGKNKETFKCLFTGDISSEVEASIKDKISDVTYLKVAHHGSKYSTSNDFLDKSCPEITVISAGIDNSYGHPHKETLERLEEHNCNIYNTAEMGEIFAMVKDGKVYVETYK